VLDHPRNASPDRALRQGKRTPRLATWRRLVDDIKFAGTRERFGASLLTAGLLTKRSATRFYQSTGLGRFAQPGNRRGIFSAAINTGCYAARGFYSDDFPHLSGALKAEVGKKRLECPNDFRLGQI